MSSGAVKLCIGTLAIMSLMCPTRDVAGRDFRGMSRKEGDQHEECVVQGTSSGTI